MTLDEIFIQESTDKSSTCHNYSKFYEMFWESIRNEPVSLLEWGIDSGFSLRSWRKYFSHPKTEISGIDIRGNYEYLINEGCKATYIVDQTNKNAIEEFALAHHNEYMIIIDDATHNSDDQWNTMEIMFPALKRGGWYVIEDVLCGHDPRWTGSGDIVQRAKSLVGDVNINGKVSHDWLCSDKNKQVPAHPECSYLEANIEFVFFAMGLVIIKKMP